MKIYFAGSIRGGRDDASLYHAMIELLGKYGTVLTEHVGDATLSQHGEEGVSRFIYKRDIAWIQEADVVVAEVTTPSLGVGYEIGFAEALGKKILCVFRQQPERKLSAMILGNSALRVEAYDDLKHVETLLSVFFKQ